MADVLDERSADRAVSTRRRRRWPWLAGATAIAVIVFVLFWFQPQKLFIDDRVDEAIPSVTTAPQPQDAAGVPTDAPNPSGPASTAPAPAEPVELAQGSFVSLDHGTTGTARVLELADGRRIVRLEELDTDNGPDLYLYLTANRANGDEDAFDDDHLNLGRLKGNQGDQNYDLPLDADIGRLGTVVIWCDRFNSAFGAADLTLI
jgi:hypothetical protein